MPSTHESRSFAVITGASRGIGAEYARALAAKGYDLLLVARDKSRLEHLASELALRHGVRVDIESLDLAEASAAHRLYVVARQHRVAVDLLINNAGFGLFGTFVDMPMARIQEMLHVHVTTIVETMRLFLPDMIERRSGGIINVASVAGLFSLPYLAEYAATKAFLIRFSEALAEEVQSFGVHIQVCCPGSTETDFHRTAGFRPKNLLSAQTPAEVVDRSLKTLTSRRSMVMTSWQGSLLMILSRYAPRGVLLKAAAKWMNPAGRDK